MARRPDHQDLQWTLAVHVTVQGGSNERTPTLVPPMGLFDREHAVEFGSVHGVRPSPLESLSDDPLEGFDNAANRSIDMILRATTTMNTKLAARMM